jgi:hypothetical protein
MNGILKYKIFPIKTLTPLYAVSQFQMYPESEAYFLITTYVLNLITCY